MQLADLVVRIACLIILTPISVYYAERRKYGHALFTFAMWLIMARGTALRGIQYNVGAFSRDAEIYNIAHFLQTAEFNILIDMLLFTGLFCLYRHINEDIDVHVTYSKKQGRYSVRGQDKKGVSDK